MNTNQMKYFTNTKECGKCGCGYNNVTGATSCGSCGKNIIHTPV